MRAVVHPALRAGGGRAFVAQDVQFPQRLVVFVAQDVLFPQRLNIRYYIDFTHLLRCLLANGSTYPIIPNHSNNLNIPLNGAGCGQDTHPKP